MYCLFMWNVYCIFCYIRYHTWYNYVHRKAYVLAYFSYLLIFVFVLTQNFIKIIPNVYFMAILMKLATCHVRNTFERPLRPNAPTVRVLTSVILKGIGWAFRKLYSTKIPGMVHQGLLAPQHLIFIIWQVMKYREICIKYNQYLKKVIFSHVKIKNVIFSHVKI